jgi:hypothetical protein
MGDLQGIGLTSEFLDQGKIKVQSWKVKNLAPRLHIAFPYHLDSSHTQSY